MLGKSWIIVSCWVAGEEHCELAPLDFKNKYINIFHWRERACFQKFVNVLI